MTRLKVVIAAGGTAGHINPALALAGELKRRGHEVVFFGQPHKLEGTLVPQAGFELVPIRVSGLDRSRPWTAVTALVRLAKAKGEVGKWMKQTGRADVAVGFGAYVEMPLLNWCASAGVPYVLHEQNSVIGLANKMAAKRAAAICLGFPQAEGQFLAAGADKSRIVMTGNPVRESVLAADGARAREARGIAPDEELLVVFGGSLGAKTLNTAMAQMKSEILSRPNVRVVQATGKQGYDEAVAELALTDEEAKRWDIVPYVQDMGDLLKAADLVVSRAGASSLAEIAAIGVPAVLVPYPFATEDHQRTNAGWLVDAGAAILIDDSNMTDEVHQQEILSLLDDRARRDAMRAAAAGLGSAAAAQRLADAVERASGRA